MVIVDVVLWYKKRALNSGIDENFPITSQEKTRNRYKSWFGKDRKPVLFTILHIRCIVQAKLSRVRDYNLLSHSSMLQVLDKAVDGVNHRMHL